MIAHQREAPAGELNPNLVAAAGVEPDADKTGFSLCQPHIFQPGLFYAAALALYHKDLVLPAVLPEQIRPVTL